MIEVKETRGYMAGDRVRLTRTGEAGEVVVLNAMQGQGMLGIRFDAHSAQRHDLGGAVRNGYGWWVYPHEIERE